MIRLALIRHGHTGWNRAGRIQGRSDIPLDDDARQGLAELTLPAPWDTARLWSSPLERAVETARLIGSRAPDTAPRLTEMNWGDWEGQRGVDLLAQDDFRLPAYRGLGLGLPTSQWRKPATGLEPPASLARNTGGRCRCRLPYRGDAGHPCPRHGLGLLRTAALSGQTQPSLCGAG